MKKMYALITFDLNKKDEKNRNNFYKNLKNAGWTRLEELSTAWITYKSEEDEKTLKKQIIKDIKLCAAKTDINSVKYVLQVGCEEIKVLDTFDIDDYLKYPKD